MAMPKAKPPDREAGEKLAGLPDIHHFSDFQKK
jgi:hypothetical protein